MRRRFNERRILFFILIGAAAIVLFTGAVMLLWNNILAGVLKISTITFPQALGILVLSKILFGGFRGGWRGNRHHWKHGMQDKWATMSPEERIKFKEQWQKRCGPWWKEEPGVGSQESGVGSRESGA
jgi:hypothetical protein